MKILVLFAVALQASAVEILTWQQCVERAAKFNSELQSNVARVRATKALEGAARADYLPQVNGKIEFNREMAFTRGIKDPTIQWYAGSIGASQNLFAGFQHVAKNQLAKFNTQSQMANLENVRAKISYDLKVAYQGLKFSKDYEQFTGEIVRRREENYNLVKLRFQNGRENKGNVLLSLANFNQAKLEALQSQNARKVSEQELAKTLGFDQWTELDIQGEIPVRDPASNKPNLKSLAMTTPDFRRARAEEEASRQQITVAKSAFMPTLDARGYVAKEDDSFFPQNRYHWQFGVVLNIPLFNGGRDFYQTRSAAESWSVSEQNRVNVNREQLSKLQQAYNVYVEAAEKLRVDESFRQAASTRAEIARKKYNNGLLSFEDWDQIETDLINRERNFIQSKRDRVTSEAAWEKALGIGAVHE